MKFYLKISILLTVLIIPFINLFQIKSSNKESCEEIINNKVIQWSILKIKESNSLGQPTKAISPNPA